MTIWEREKMIDYGECVKWKPKKKKKYDMVMMWLNWSITIINIMLQLLDIYRFYLGCFYNFFFIIWVLVYPVFDFKRLIIWGFKRFTWILFTRFDTRKFFLGTFIFSWGYFRLCTIECLMNQNILLGLVECFKNQNILLGLIERVMEWRYFLIYCELPSNIKGNIVFFFFGKIFYLEINYEYTIL